MISKITSKFQTTIPKKVRNKLKLNVSDIIDWKIDGEQVIVESSKKPFLKHRAKIKLAPGNIKDDIRNARKIIAESHK